LISQSAISNDLRGGRRKLPYALTEHGAIMAASVLNTPRAVEMSVFVVRAFIDAIKRLMAPPGKAATRRIGFGAEDESSAR
jgi:hypothetical protein